MWVPRVDAGWAPYRQGHWAWISPWGWTWIDDASWGFAPFHYGRWAYLGNHWCWVPGPIAVRPVYAPALVVFVGGGPGGRNVGWFPLGPREVFVPGYHVSREYVTRVNVTNTIVNSTTVTNVYNRQMRNDERGKDRGNNEGNDRNNSEIKYANRNAPGGVTVVTRDTFAGAKPVGRAMVAVDQKELVSGPVSHMAEVAPTRTSVIGNSAPAGNRVPHPSDEVVNRSVIAKRTPPPSPVPFEKQQEKLAAQPGEPLAKTDVEGLRPPNVPAAQSHVRQAPPGKPATAESNQPARKPGDVALNPPPATVRANPPVNDIPLARDDRSNGANRSQPTSMQPSKPATASVGAKPPVIEMQGQPTVVRPSNPPARNNRSTSPSRGGSTNATASNPPPAKVSSNPPVNNLPPAHNEKPSVPETSKPAEKPANQPPKEPAPKPLNDKKGPEVHKEKQL